MPQMIDKETRLDATYGTPDGKLNYKYILVNYAANELDFSQIEQELAPTINNTYCTSPEIKIYRDKSIPFSYHYYSSDGVFIGDIEADPSSCS